MTRASVLLALVLAIALAVWLAFPRAADSHFGPTAPSEGEATVREPTPQATEAKAPQPSRSALDAPRNANDGVTPAKTASVTGRVLDALGHPLADCTVAFSELEADFGDVPTRKVATNQTTTLNDGRFRLVLGAHAPGVLTLVHRDFPLRVAVHRLQVEQDDTRNLGDLTLFSQAGLVVHVRTRAHAAVPNAVVTASPALRDVSLPAAVHELAERTGVTDGNGVALLYGVPPGPYTVRVEAAHCATREQPHVQPDESVSAPGLNIFLDAGHTIGGRVEWQHDAAPGRIMVHAEPTLGGAALSAEADPSGDFRITGALSGRYLVRVESTQLGRAQTEADVPGRRVSLALDGGKSLHGVVRARATGLPVTGAIVRAEPEDGWPMVRAGETVRPAVVTSSDGFFRVLGLEDGRFTLLVTSERFVPARLGPFATDSDSDSDSIEVLLDRGLTVRGVLRCNGQAVAGANVRAIDWENEGAAFALWKASLTTVVPRTTSAADGTFQLSGLAARGERLVVESEGCAVWFSTALIGTTATAADESLDLGSIVLAAGAAIEGTAEAHATVRLDCHADRGLSRNTHADGKGRFAFRNLPAGDYTLFYSSAEAATPPAAPRAPNKKTITLAVGDRQQVSLLP